jgi:ABC-type Fe3+-siderophore transport system permease subunit
MNMSSIGAVLALVLLPLFTGVYADIEWSDKFGHPTAGIVGFIAAAAIGVFIVRRARRWA